MKRILLLAAVLSVAVSGQAFAMGGGGIGNRLGITARGGIIEASDQKDTSPGGTDLSSVLGYTYSAGFIYGLNNNVAIELGVDHSRFDAEEHGVRNSSFTVNDVVIGGQYRFLGTAPMMQPVVPYVGGGIDIFVTDMKVSGVSLSVDPSVGAHIQAGADIFLNPHFALNAEVKGTLATETDARLNGVTQGKYNGSSFQALCGLRLFF